MNNSQRLEQNNLIEGLDEKLKKETIENFAKYKVRERVSNELFKKSFELGDNLKYPVD